MNPFRVVATFLLALILPAAAAVVDATFTTAATVPITAAGYTATGNTVNFTLTFAPPVGTNLTVVKNTGLPFIQGTFANLAQGQQVTLSYHRIAYPFVANYFGGTGNDLVLQWANTRLLTWGRNNFGQLGQNHTTQSNVPAPVTATGVLAGKTILTVAAGDNHCLALGADGSLAAWGYNVYGQLGDHTTTGRDRPVAVDQSGILATKRVVAIAGGGGFSLALCADGTVVGWGINDYGQLGNGTTTNQSVPTAVTTTTGALVGKKVVAIAAGGRHALALCSDGTLAAWGENESGQLGTGSGSYLNAEPVVVTKGTLLQGKTIAGLKAGGLHNLVWCTDGTLAAWGSNGSGALGNNSVLDAHTPTAVTKTGVLSGKTIAAIAANGASSLVLCTDSTLAAWGDNTNGNLGNGGTTLSRVPALVTRTGVLLGKTIVSAGVGAAVCTDGTLATWGDNTYGQLGNNTTSHSSVPVLVNSGALRTGELPVAAATGWTFRLAVVASPPPPSAVTASATEIGDASATLHGMVNPNGQPVTVSFEYGLSTSYGSSVPATSATVTGTADTAVSGYLSGLLPGKTYHSRLVANSPGGMVPGADREFTTTTQATLTGLTPSVGTLMPGFDPAISSYAITVPAGTAFITLTPTTAHAGSDVTVAGATVVSGTASAAVDLTAGTTAIPVAVTAADEVSRMTYTVTVTRLPEVMVFNEAAGVQVTAAAFDARGKSATMTLGFAPKPGTVLTVVNNTGRSFIEGRFDNLTQGQMVGLEYDGVVYQWVANYYGGTGNDLVLLWANSRLVSWGANGDGQAGNGSLTSSSAPLAVNSGVLTGRTVTAVVCRDSFSLALCADGTLAAWGNALNGQIGDGADPTFKKSLPTLVDRSGVLAGRSVVAIAASGKHCLALCEDGGMVTWGDNEYGQLGNNSQSAYSSTPVRVESNGVLAGRSVVAIAAGGRHNLALCADGGLVAWGDNGWLGQLGNNGSALSRVPVPVDQNGALANKNR